MIYFQKFILRNIFLHHCYCDLVETTTEHKLKSSCNWEFDCESKKSTEDKLHKIWNSNFFAKIQENEHTPGVSWP